MMKAVEDVLAERRRQREKEGWSIAHDDGHFDGSLAAAATCYATPPDQRLFIQHRDKRDVARSAGETILVDDYSLLPYPWPESWHRKWWKPKNRRRDLVRAAALLIAEIERIDRAVMRGRAAP